MGSGQVGNIRRIVIIVIYENRHGDSGNIVSDLLLALAATGKAQVDMIKIQFSGQNRSITVSGAGCAPSLCDGRTVEYNGLFIPVRLRGFQHCPLLQADLQIGNGAIQGEMQCNAAHFPSAQIYTAFIATLDPKGRHKGFYEFSVGIQIKAGRAAEGKMSHFSYYGHDCADGNVRTIGLKSQSATGRVGAEGMDTVTDRCSNRFRQAAVAITVKCNTKDAEGRGVSIMKNCIRLVDF